MLDSPSPPPWAGGVDAININKNQASAKILDILEFPHDILTKAAEPIKEITDEIKELSYNMLATMYTKGGIGLAAPQVGVLKALIVLDASNKRNSPVVLINPRIRGGGKAPRILEGCLSFPGLFFKVKRFDTVFVSAQSIDNPKPFNFTARGLPAICIQHEVDHLKGRTFLDLLPNKQKRRFLKSFEISNKWGTSQ